MRAIALRNAQPLDKHLTSDHPQVEALAKHLYENYIHQRSCPRFDNLQDAITAVVLNLYSALLNEKERYVRYSRTGERSTEDRYNRLPLTWRKLDRVIKALNGENSALIDHEVGIPGRESFGEGGRQSRMRANETFRELILKTFGLQPEMIQRVDDEVIILKDWKDEDGYAPRVRYRDNATTRPMRTNLEQINAYLADTWIDIFVSDEELRDINVEMSNDDDRVPIDFRRTRLRRIFNNKNFELGGRFYHGWWQEVPRRYRSYIQINGRQTEELDFSGMHFEIFYARVGASAPEDPYALPRIEATERGMVKKALNAIINATDTQKAIGAIRKEARKSPLPATYPTAESLVQELREMHRPIEQYFCTGEGIHAQFLDSQVAQRVMLELLQKQDIAVLPVHDSFIVERHHVEFLRDAMSEAFEAIIKSDCGIDAKIPHWRLAREAFPEPDSIRRTREAIESASHDGYYGREREFERQLRRRAEQGESIERYQRERATRARH